MMSLKKKILRAIGDVAERQNNRSAGKHAVPVLSGDPTDHRWYRAPVEGGLSSDGSGYYIYLRKGTVNRLAVMFAGGGACWDEQSASHPNSMGGLLAGEECYYEKCLSPRLEPGTVNAGMTLDNEKNPFRDWSHVTIMYSTGDLHIGNSVMPYKAVDDSDRELHFHGYQNFRESMKIITSIFPAPEQLLIGGDSAGGFGAVFLADEIIDSYNDCPDITLCADCCHLASDRWKWITEEVWQAPASIISRIRSRDIVLDMFQALYEKYGDHIRYLYIGSMRDSIMSVFHNVFNHGTYGTRAEIQEEYAVSVSRMVRALCSSIPGMGFYLQDFSTTGLAAKLFGGSAHTLIRNAEGYRQNPEGVCAIDWLYEAVNGKVGRQGMELLRE